MDWFLYGRNFRHKKVIKQVFAFVLKLRCSEKSQENVNG